ncbi:MAG: hypothetical protein LBU89_08320 [Fibromonadaceae bacterium]|jgi:hypothetical protein|nr:hypothetical protein [Fibromonadaceae bacterium]
MKKYSLYFTLLALSAFIAFLAACGSGDIINLDDQSSDEFRSWKKTNDDFDNFLTYCINPNNSEDPDCPPISSESYEPSSSSDGGGDPGSSSSEGGGTSSDGTSSQGGVSSSQGGVSSSSSIPYVPSSSSADPNAYQVSPFTCAWNPPSVVAGKGTQAGVTVAAEDAGADCTREIFFPIPILNQMGMPTGSYNNVLLSLTTEYTAGFGQAVPGAAGVSWPAEPAGAGASAVFGAWARVRCTGDGKPEGSREQECPLTISKPPNPTKQGGTSIAWNARSWTGTPSSIFFIGETPANSASSNVAIVQNDAAEYCGDIVYALESRPAGGAWAAWTPAPLTAAEVSREVRVIARCALSGFKVDSTVAATVVANPSLSGTCNWSNSNNAYAGGATATVTAAPTITSQYGRTCTGPSFYVGSTVRSLVSEGLAVPNFVSGGNNTVSNITIGATCGGTALTPSITCSNITVRDPAATCEYMSSWCGGRAINTPGAVYTPTGNATNDSPMFSGTWATGYCIFVTGATNFQGLNSTFTINGQPLPTNCTPGSGSGSSFATCTNGIERADGGYYIWRPAEVWWNLQGTQGGSISANCSGP